jgi:hypothetical protein
MLSVCEVSIIAALATLFAAFSSPFLTAIFTLGVFVVGRSAETLGNLPERMVGATVRSLCQAASRVVPNLMLYVPERRLLTGELAGASTLRYVALGGAHALAWVVVLLAIAGLVLRRRDFL